MIGKYWGYAVLAALVWGWWAADDRGEVAPLLVAGSLLTIAYFLFQVPRTCGAEGRLGPCRNNAHGLMFGCNQVREHKRQNLARRFRLETWRKVNRGLWSSPKDSVATASCLASVASGMAAVATLVVGAG